AGASELANAAAKTPATATTLYTIQTQPFWLSEKAGDHNDGNLMASTEVKVVKREGDMVLADVHGWQQDGVTEAFYAARGKRIMSALLGEEARKALKVSGSVTDEETKQVWHEVDLQVWLPAKNLIGDQQKIWSYASELMANNCTGCHGLTELNRFNANQWIGVVKGMSGRTSLTQEQVRLLTQYVQKHASDMPAAANQDKQ
ncbi:cytochrome C, partial [Escherichia coli]|nr:cytochrome C [Escherichia coli]